jgi:lambda family phage minor tail protein L
VLKNDIQKLEPGSLVTLIEVDTSSFGGDVLYFHGHNIAFSQKAVENLINPLYAGSLKWYAGTLERPIGEGGVPSGTGIPIFWKGNKYTAWPCQVEGIEADSTGQPTSPTLAVGNIDGTISSLCLFFDDLVQAKVTIRQTLSKYLDSENFTTINPDADPTQEVVETWYIDAKTQEDNQTITWQLSNPADLSGQIIPARLITGMCQWALKGDYRGADCGYLGTAMFDENDNPVTDPADDKCGGLLSSCKLRFGESEQLSFGGMPSANLLGR